MSTRATYQFTRGTIYIHHDGYPEGAASYFARAACADGAGDLERMIRGNDRAELTTKHEDHGDTEYRYTVDGKGQIVAKKLVGWDSPKWETFFIGSLADFINKHVNPEWGEECKNTFVMYGSTCVTQDWLTKYARERLEYAWHALDKGWTGNANGAAGDVARLVKLGAQIPKPELMAVLTATCETCPHMVEYYLNAA